MPYQSQPEAEEEPPRGDTTQRLRTIERWLHHVEDELLYAPDAQGETAATSLDARYYLRWGGGGLGVLAIERFPLDARHPLTQQPYGAYAVGEVFPVMYQGQRYQGRVIERLVSRAEAWWSSTCWPRQRRRTRRKASHGEQKEEPMSLLHVEGVTHWSIPVNNLEEAEAFYGDLLGLTPVGRLGTSRIACFTAGGHHILLCERAATVDHTFVEDAKVHHSFTVSPETLVRACKVFRERQIRVEHLYHRKEGVFPGRELYFFDPSGNRLELRDPTWHAGMPEPTFEDLANR